MWKTIDNTKGAVAVVLRPDLYVFIAKVQFSNVKKENQKHENVNVTSWIK